ncbi:MAG: amidohydrolase family protein [Deltaproteobacteria bacterium]|nr:amidohydrolase family protein [Deltaproteobacteria bacterium]
MPRVSILLLLSAALLAAPASAHNGMPHPDEEEHPKGPAQSRAEAEERGQAPIEVTPTVTHAPYILVGGKVMTANGAVHDPGYVKVKDGRIRAVGAGAPSGTEEYTLIDVSGQVVTPGLIDTHSHLGVYPSPWAKAHSDGNEATAPTTPGVWAEHSAWPQDPGFQRAVEGGITSLQLLPGSANLIGGRGVVMRPIPTRGSRAMRFPGAPETVKMACGENPKRVYGDKGGPSTRMGNLRAFRTAFTKADALRTKWQKLETDEEAEASPKKRKKKGDEEKPPEPPDRDLDLETLVAVLEGEILVQVHCYRADDMLSVMQVADEFGFSIRSFHHALEAYKIRDLLVEADISASTWSDWWGFKLEAYDGIPQNAALLEQAGGRPIIHSDSAEGIQRLNQEAAKARRDGLRQGIDISENAALRWVTYNPAWALGIQEETGTLEVGKRADLVVWTGSPFSVYSEARLVFIDGALRHDVDRPQEPWADFEVGQDLPLQEGGAR